jgi:hypothetical protein
MLVITYLLVTSFVCLLILKFNAIRQRKGLTFYYKNGNPLIDSFIRKTQISKLQYEPYLPAFNQHAQGFFYTLYADISRYFKLLELEFERELFKLEDGGMIAMDWFDGRPLA